MEASQATRCKSLSGSTDKWLVQFDPTGQYLRLRTRVASSFTSCAHIDLMQIGLVCYADSASNRRSVRIDRARTAVRLCPIST